jgi:hypothetical protein
MKSPAPAEHADIRNAKQAENNRTLAAGEATLGAPLALRLARQLLELRIEAKQKPEKSGHSR